MIPRIIPILLLKNKGLYKGAKFKDYQYVGDPLNAVKIFNDLECDELIFLDIEASKKIIKSTNNMFRVLQMNVLCHFALEVE